MHETAEESQVFGSLLQSLCHKLTDITLYKCKFFAPALLPFSAVMQKLILRHCYLEEARFSAHECMHMIQGAPQLRDLSLLQSYFDLEDTPAVAEEFWSAVGTHSSLVKLCLDEVYWMGFNECAHLVSQAHQLEVLFYHRLWIFSPSCGCLTVGWLEQFEEAASRQDKGCGS